MSPAFTFLDREAKMVDGPITREPTADEAIDIWHHLRQLQREGRELPLGREDIQGMGVVWFRKLSPAAVPSTQVARWARLVRREAENARATAQAFSGDDPDMQERWLAKALDLEELSEFLHSFAAGDQQPATDCT